MKQLSILFGMALLTLGTISCNGTKEMDKKNEEAAAKAAAEASFDSTGFTSGIIVNTKQEGDCEFAIQTDDGIMFDPIDLTTDYKKADAKIWFKFARLRRPTRCGQIQPIRVEEIRMQ